MNAAIDGLRDPATIRARARTISAAVADAQSPYWQFDESRLESAAQTVAEITRTRYPTLAIPYHSRWRHFEAGGVDRAAELDAALAGRDPDEQARSRIDLAIVAVLLDAGAGPQWHYRDGAHRCSRSEGLAVASFRAFMAGAFSSDPAQPLRVDGAALQQFDAGRLAALFQVHADNPLVGLDGRVELLRRLGQVLQAQPQAFGADARPGGLFDLLTDHGRHREIDASALLRAVLDHSSDIWLAGNRLAGVALGDVWPHPLAGGCGYGSGWMPFHKLSQWLTYSLFEPFEWAGITVNGREALTGLAEYRNGGLLIDSGVLNLRDPPLAEQPWRASDTLIVEWRALTVHLLDVIADRVRALLGRSREELPLACVLEGGTWAAGRALAQLLSEIDRLPPDTLTDRVAFPPAR
ncbi:MAG: URC4/urg3 family protein [Nevskia sp.]|uniref:URC4/urg3 family protein n=1 Tax=Nevskia sp. TaxID=1929292 RepID=UPI0040356F3C